MQSPTEVRSPNKRMIGKALFLALSVIIFIWTMYLTSTFLTNILPGTFWLVPYMGVAVFDFGMIAWMLVHLYGAEGASQRMISLGLTLFNLIGVGLICMTEIIIGGQTLTEIPPMLGTIAIFSVGIWTTANVAGIVGYHLSSPHARLIAAIQDEKEATTGEAIQVLKNNRTANAKLLAAHVGGGMYRSLEAELGYDGDGDGIPDITERHADVGRPAAPITSRRTVRAAAAIGPPRASVPVATNGARETEEGESSPDAGGTRHPIGPLLTPSPQPKRKQRRTLPDAEKARREAQNARRRARRRQQK